jgi:glycosyltransferase involved in cell wall biosynthesis
MTVQTVSPNLQQYPQAALTGGFFLRVLIVTETWPPEVNGVALTVSGYREGLRSRGVEVHVLRPRQEHEGETPPAGDHLVAGLRLPRYPELRFGVAGSRRVRSLLEEIRPHALYIATEGPLGLVALQAARRLGVPVASGFHTNFDQFIRYYGAAFLGGIADSYLRWFHNRASSTLVGTDELVSGLSARGFRNVRFHPRGVDSVRFNPKWRDDELRARWGATPDMPVLVSVGRLAPEKNLELVLRSWRVFRSRRPDARLVIVGNGPMRDGLEATAGAGVVFAGMQKGEALARNYASADILLFPSETETFGNITLEGMASGLLTVAYDYAAARQTITDGIDGYKVRCGDPAAWIERVAGLAGTDTRPATAMRVAARTRAEELDMGIVHQALEEILREHAA